MSIVISTYNGARTLGRTLESLLAQDYPKDRYEIIVVNDGSTDDTEAVASQYPVRVHSLPYNQGISAGRNAGLQLVRGDVYVNFDDDTIAAPNWLGELARGYELSNVAGVGGRITEPAQLHSLVDRYMTVTGCGNPAPLTLGASKSPWQRFTAYIRDRLQPVATPTEIAPVRELNGANASFPVSVLRTIGGWAADMHGVEDTEICKRIAQVFPELQFYGIPTALITHDPKLTFYQYIRRPFRRGPVNLRYYRRYGMTPPLFPFPLAWVFVTLLSLLLNPFVGLAVAMLAPQALYVWWPLRAIRERQLSYLAFPYIQLSEEAAVLAGLAKGYLASRREDSHA